MDPINLLELPLETITVLAAGYLGYRLAYTGKDEAHRGVDVVFITLVFGLVAKSALGVAAALGAPVWGSVASAPVAALAAAALWRRWGQEGTFRLLRLAKVSMADGQPTALQSVVLRESIAISQVQVRRRDGVWFLCDDVSKFGDTPTGPYWFGEDGSIALYVTQQKSPGDAEWEDIADGRRDRDWGDLITIIPADEVSMIEIRTK